MAGGNRFLLRIADLSLSKVRPLLKNLTKAELKSIRDLMINILDGTHQLTEEELRNLSPYKKFIRKLAYKGLKTCEMNKYCNLLLKVIRLVKPFLKRIF